MEVVPVPQLSDNYAYLVIDPATREAGVVDCAEAEPVLAEARRRGLRLVAVLATHHHFDHSGGLGAFVAAGIPIITHEKNRRYFEGIFKTRRGLDGDPVARSRRAAVIEAVGDKRVLTDATMTLELHHLRGNLHAETLLVGYLPRQKLLIQADAFHPRPGAAPLPAPPPYTVNLVENIRRLKLDIERVVHVHGGVDPLAVVVKAGGG